MSIYSVTNSGNTIIGNSNHTCKNNMNYWFSDFFLYMLYETFFALAKSSMSTLRFQKYLWLKYLGYLQLTQDLAIFHKKYLIKHVKLKIRKSSMYKHVDLFIMSTINMSIINMSTTMSIYYATNSKHTIIFTYAKLIRCNGVSCHENITQRTL